MEYGPLISCTMMNTIVELTFHLDAIKIVDLQYKRGDQM